VQNSSHAFARKDQETHRELVRLSVTGRRLIALDFRTNGRSTVKPRLQGLAMRLLFALSVAAFLAVPAIASDPGRKSQRDTVSKAEESTSEFRFERIQFLIAEKRRYERLQEQWRIVKWIATPEWELLKMTGVHFRPPSASGWRVVAVHHDGKLKTMHVIDCSLFRILVNESLYSLFQKPE
jgi:hypothetical protein